MKNLILAVMLAVSAIAPISQAHTIGGAYASLLSCEWEQWGYEHGYVGTYDVEGRKVQQFFGNDYCEY